VMGSVDKTLFTLNHGTEFLLDQIYVEDIIFGACSHTLVLGFQEMMEKEFQMSMMGGLTIFLGIQVKQMAQSTFVHQVKYTKVLMKKFNMAELKLMSTLMSTTTSLDPDENGKANDKGVQEHDWLPPVHHGDTAEHLVHRVPLCMLLGFPTLFTPDSHLANLQVYQTYS
jgi:hypothetical protein